VADITKAKQLIGWTPKITKEEGIDKMLEWLKNE
jgi:CDP-paratose 2-epimerase